MSLLQIKKLSFHIILAFLIIVLLSSNIHVRAEDIDKGDKAQALWEQGIKASEEKDYQLALEKFNDSLAIFRKIGDRQSEADVLILIIEDVCLKLKNYSDADMYCQQALNIYKGLGKKEVEGNLLIKIGAFHILKGDFSKSLEYFNKALKIFEQIDDKKGIAYAMDAIGTVYFEQGDYSNAQVFHDRALILYQDIGDKENEALAASSLGNDYRLLGSLDIALKYYKQALDTTHELGNLSYEEGLLFYGIGQLYSNMGDNKEALEAYNKAMQIFEEHNHPIQGEILIEVGVVNSNLANYLEAISNLEEGLEILKSPKDDTIMDSDRVYYQRKALRILAEIYIRLGDDEKAKEYDLKRKGIEGTHYSVKKRRMSSLLDYGNLFFKEEKYDKALDNYQQALALSKEIGNKSYEGRLLCFIGDTYKTLGEYLKALDFYRQSLKVSSEQKDKGTELTTLCKMAFTYYQQQDYRNALSYIKKSLKIAKEIGDKYHEEYCFAMMASVYRIQKKYEKEAEYYERALRLSKEINEQNMTWQYQQMLGLNAENSEQLQKAKGCYSEAINTIESIRGRISVEEYKIGFMGEGNKLLVYDNMIRVLWSLKEYEEAFNYVERAKSRSLLDLLGNRVKLKKGKDKELSQEEMKLQKKINETLKKIRKEQSQPKEKQRAVLTKWNKEVEQTRKEYTDLLINIKRENPELYSMVSVNPLNLKEIQMLIEPDTTLLEYYFDGYFLYCWIVNKNEYKFFIQSLPELASKITSFREKIATLQPDYEKEAEELYDLLIRPAKPYIKTKRICIVPHSILHYLPFQALLNVPVFGGIGLFNERLASTVIYPLEGLPAYEAGLKYGDKIIAIDGNPTVDMSITEVVSKLRGEPLTTILLEVVSEESGTSKTIKLIRESIAKSSIYTNHSNVNTDYINDKEEKQSRFLIEEYDISYTPSASVLKFVFEKRKEISGKVLAFGNPELGDKNLNLPYAEDELKRIKESYPDTSIYMNEKATEDKVKQLSGNYGIIHFASHSELNPQSPLFSCIKMAKGKDEDGRLEVHEIFNLNLENVSLVTLSACETGLGKLSKGDELIGLTRAFIYAGTPSIVASLWMVNDKSTSDLMSLFYKNLKTHSKVEALRMAQLEMINGEVGRGIVRGVGGITASNEDQDNSQTTRTVNGSHPYFWAPFILLGDWK